MADQEKPYFRPEGHRYEAPESDEDRRKKGWDYLILGIVVIVILVVIATGKVQIFKLLTRFALSGMSARLPRRQ